MLPFKRQKFPIEMNDRYYARVSARNFSMAMTIVSLLNYLRWYGYDWELDWTWLLSFFSFLALSLWSLLPKQLGMKMSSLIFWLSVLVAIAGTANANLILIDRLDHFSPFGGFKLLAFGIAFLAPFPLRNGFLAVIFCGLTPILLYWTVLVDQHFKIPLPEPGITFVASVVALIGLVYRLRGIQIERENVRLRTEKENLNEFARIILILRDLTNTPLQVIKLTTDLLDSGVIEPSEASRILNNSLQKLTLISQLLSIHQFGEISEAQMSGLYDTKDPMEFLQKRLQDLKAKSNPESSSESSP